MRQKVISIFLCYLLLYTCGGVEARLLAMGLPALGFTATGIAANSWAASMMSWSAVANGGGVPAGGLVATLQSLGATGGSTLMAKVGGFLGFAAYQHQKNKKSKEEE
ncbi:interferon alpha inducible protein 6 [Phyllostomus discolor]|uniref:Interferon alpha inducible protein 6 n=1 Tax=Phyllostomus discolor TaxID=89673 RepID=A0A834ACT4_9CHIR|nr:interferon alpha inducible protein 6 [Phyllostomus discolor]